MSARRLQARADLYARLAAMEEAGLPPARAFAVLGEPADADLAEPARRAARALGSGGGVAAAGRRTGLFAPGDADLVAAYGEAGSPAPVYRLLAEQYAAAARRARRIRSRLYLPVVIGLLALVLGPLPQVVAGELGAGAYAGRTFLALAAVGLACALARQLPVWLERARRSRAPLARAWDALGLRWPLLGALHRRRLGARFLEALAVLLEGGLPAGQAVRIAARAVPNRVVGADLERRGRRVEQGQPLARTLAGSPYLGGELARIATAAEAAGRLAPALAHLAAAERARIEAAEEEVAAWVPRIAYLIVAGWLAAQLIGSGLPLPPG